MSTSPEPVRLLARVLDETADIIGAVSEDQQHLPTPCKSWNVFVLVNHMIADLPRFTARARGQEFDGPDLVFPVDDWHAAFRHGCGRLNRTWQNAGDLAGTVELPDLGEVPAGTPVEQQLAEFAVHAWDLAQATDQKVSVDSDVAESALRFLQATLSAEARGTESEGRLFAPAIDITDAMTAPDRLAAFAGRSAAARARVRQLRVRD